MLSLPNLARSVEGFLPNNSTLRQKNRNEKFRHEIFCETQIDTFTLIPLRNGEESTSDDNENRPVSRLSAITGDRHENAPNGEKLSSQADCNLMFKAPANSVTIDNLFELNLRSQDGRNTRTIKPLDKYFESVEKEILSRQRYDRELSGIHDDAREKTAAKNRSFYLENDSEVNDEIDVKTARTKGQRTLEFTVDPTLRDSHHGNAHVQYGGMFRALLHRTERQHKERSKLIHDNAIAEEKLKEANGIIERLTEKIQRRRLVLKCKEESQRSLEENIESLKKERDKKHAECTRLITELSNVMDERGRKIDELAKRQMKFEASYHQEVQNNIELKSRLESKERHIRSLKEKVEKARKWKNDNV